MSTPPTTAGDEEEDDVTDLTRPVVEVSEGPPPSELVIEDVVTSGGQVVISTGELRNLGAHVDHALCVIDRQEGGAQALATEGITLRAPSIPLISNVTGEWIEAARVTSADYWIAQMRQPQARQPVSLRRVS